MAPGSSGDTLAIGIEINSKKLLAVAVENGRVADRLEAERIGSADAAREISEFSLQAVERFGRPRYVGVALPGLIDHAAGRVAHSERMPENMNIDFRSILQSIELDVRLENDANAAAYGEYRFGAARGASSLFYATIDLGVGGAFVLDGQIWRGFAGFAGEFGYIAIDEDGLRLEDVASVENIARRTRERLNRDSTSSLGRLSEEEIGISEIINAADEGDDLAVLMLSRTGTYIGTAVATVINLLNVEMIVLGGQVMRAGSHILDAIISRAADLSFEPAFSATTILKGQLGDDAAAIGSALIASES